ncbi:MAG: methyltransferase [Candidatus Altiarchaeota archaeon]
MFKVKALRLVLILFFMMILPSLASHYVWLMGGQGLGDILTGRWDIALINIVFFTSFLFLTHYRAKVEWRSKGIYTAFILALFAEMYGFPLTAYFIAKYFGPIPSSYAPSHSITFRFLDVHFKMPSLMIAGSAITVIGLSLIIAGWIKVYRSKGAMVSDGVYKLMRHPQYTGILLVTLGWLIHWPTLLTLLIWPFLALTYLRLARAEEEYMVQKFPFEFEKYKKETPMFL